VKVILRQKVAKLGEAGALVNVADGYARNFLIPRGLAYEATPANLRRWEADRKEAARQADRQREEAVATAARLAEVSIVVTARAGESGKLFGSITAADIAERLVAETGVEVDRRRINLSEPLKELGEHKVEIRLHPEVTAEIPVRVEKEE